MRYTEDVINRIKSLKKDRQTLFVAIDGFGGSGKSTLAKELKNALGEGVDIVSLDDFSYPADKKRLIEQIIAPLKNSTKAKYQKYDWDSKSLKEWLTIEPGSIVIIEGLTSLHPELRKYYDLTIWLSMDQGSASERGINRDLNEYGVDVRNKWENEWKPMEKEYVESYRPQDTADFILG